MPHRYPTTPHRSRSGFERMSGAHVFPFGGDATGAAIRALDWSGSALGPVETWPATLRTTVNIVLASAFPTFVL